MGEQLATTDGEVLDVEGTERDFAAALAAPPADKPGMAAPDKRPPEPEPDPEAAPHGWTFVDGQWRPKRTSGRPRKDRGDKPRVTETPPAPATPLPGPGASGKTVDYQKVSRETAEAAWFVLASVPVPAQAFGYKLGDLRTKLRVQAALIEANVENLAAGVATIAPHNKFVRAALGRMAAGEGGLWVLPATMLLAPLVAQTGQLWSGQLLLEDGVSMEDVAASTEAKVAEYVKTLSGAVPAAA